jgi:Flp pilus assembly protein TadD
MDGGGPAPLPRRNGSLRTLDAQKVVPVFALVLMVGAAVAFFDLLIVRAADKHKMQTGTRLFEQGLAAKHEGRTAEALELLRSAYNQNPRNPEYQLAFAQALDLAGRTREGTVALEDLLTRHPAHGPANAEMARVLSRTPDWQRAAWYYHRALYGEWRGSPDHRSLRFELADLLARHNAREQLVSEVVLLEVEPLDAPEAKHLARLQLAAGEWARAEDLYRSLLRATPDDPELLAGLARAQLGTGRYVAAERGLRRALSAGASDDRVRQDLELVTRINEMDPTLRRLAPADKHRRAHELASSLLGILEKCSPGNAVFVDAALALKEGRGKRNQLALAEADLDLFERLWGVREQACGPAIELPRSLQLLAAQLTK